MHQEKQGSREGFRRGKLAAAAAVVLPAVGIMALTGCLQQLCGSWLDGLSQQAHTFDTTLETETDASDACGSGGTDWNRQAERLLDTWGNSVLHLAYSYLQNPSDAEDILQDTLVQYLRIRSQLKDETHEKAWMLRVAANLSKNRIAYNRIRETDPLDEQLAARQRPTCPLYGMR